MGIWYYLVCFKHNEFLFLGRWEKLCEARNKIKNYESSGVIVDKKFLNDIIKPRGKGSKMFIEKHCDCELIMGDDQGGISGPIDYRFDEFEGWIEYFDNGEVYYIG